MEIFTKEEREPLIFDDRERETQNDFHELMHARESVYEDKEIFPEGLSDEEGRNVQTMNPQKTSSFPTVVYSIINTAVGGSIFGYPYVYSKFGILFGIFMTIFGAVLTCFGSAICQKVKNLSKHSSYASIANACFGQVGRAVVSIVIIINALGSCLTYFIVFTVVAENLLRSFISSCDIDSGAPVYCQKHIYATLAALVILPFNFRKTFTKLKTISLIKVISIMLFTAITVVHAIYVIANGNMGPNIRLAPKFDEPLNFIAAFPQVLLGYNFLYNQFTLYKTMEDPSDERLGKAVKISMAFAATVCMLVGLFGYLIFGDQTTNILKNYSKDDLGAAWYLILNFAFLASSMTGIPVTFFPARNLIYHSIIRRLRIPGERDISALEEDTLRVSRRESIKKTPKGRNIFRAVVVIVTIIILVIAIVTPDLNTALGFIGSIGINCINFLFPMAFYLALSRKRGNTRRMAYAVIVFSVFVGIGGLVANSIKIAQQGAAIQQN